MTGPSEAACAMARRLDGGQRGEEITDQVKRDAAEADLVVIFAGDGGGMEIVGARDRRLGGSSPGGIVRVGDRDGKYWTFETEIPHATFDIAAGYAPWCRGIVIDLADTERQAEPAVAPVCTARSAGSVRAPASWGDAKVAAT